MQFSAKSVKLVPAELAPREGRERVSMKLVVRKLANLRFFFLTNLQKCQIIYIIEQLMTNEIVGCPASSLMVYSYFAKGHIKGKSL